MGLSSDTGREGGFDDAEDSSDLADDEITVEIIDVRDDGTGEISFCDVK